jgi:uncharacterized membrane protein YgdD (TMEM256/DUF423 family)
LANLLRPKACGVQPQYDGSGDLGHVGVMRFWTRRLWTSLAAMAGFLSVAMGAFAAHGMSDPLSRELLRTGAQYAGLHAVATLACAGLIAAGARRARFAPALFLGGIALFSGSLFALALGAPRWAGAITPVGGLLFLAGWAVLAWAAGGMRS